jgi:hypothetical protein
MFGEHFITINDKKGTCNTTVLTTTVLKYPKFFTPNNDGFNDNWNIPDFFNPMHLFLFLTDGKLLKVLLQLPLAGTEDIMVRIYHQMITGLVNYDLDGKDKIFKSHFSLKKIITKALSSNEIKYISFKPFRNLKQSESVPIIF